MAWRKVMYFNDLGPSYLLLFGRICPMLRVASSAEPGSGAKKLWTSSSICGGNGGGSEDRKSSVFQE